MRHVIVEYVPRPLAENVIYVSLKYETAIHLCPCGCGGEVITPFATGHWTLDLDDNGVTLNPSILNRFACKSHYWIRKNQVVWA